MRKMSYKKIAAFVLAGTMAIGMSATALAAGVSTSTEEEDVSSITITKKVETDGNTYAPNYTFNFSVESGPEGDYDGNKVTPGKDGDVTPTGATFTSGKDVKSEYTGTGSLSFDVRKYEKPGVYSYTVKESDVDYEGIDKDDSSYTVYVYVANKANGEGYYISNVVSTKDNTKADITFTNDYGDKNGKVHSVTIKKVVEGNQADLTMKPRLSGGDLMLYYRLQNKWYADDVVVFEKDGERYTGRIVATEGDKVDIPDEGGLHINGSTVLEADIFYPTKKYETGIEFPVTLGKNEFFILCDYREGAKDSRFFGPVKASELKGKVITVMRRTNL